MLCFPNARISLGLHVKAKRRDGFHDIESVMLPVGMYDALEIVPAFNNQTKLITSGKTIPGETDKNLVLQALKLIRDEMHLNPGRKPKALGSLHVYLRKGIPPGSGLAGGSADGVFMLKMLNAYYALNISSERLEKLAAKLGSDCPYFLYNKPMLVQGRGEILESVNTPDLSGLHLIIIVPPIVINTAEAYSIITPKPKGIPIKDTLTMPIADWQANLKNDFESVLFKKNPYLERIKNRLINQGAVYASLTGSGSALYGFFENKAIISSLRKDFNDCQIVHPEVLDS